MLEKYSWNRIANFWLHEMEKYANAVKRQLPQGKGPLRASAKLDQLTPTLGGAAFQRAYDPQKALPFAGEVVERQR